MRERGRPSTCYTSRIIKDESRVDSYKTPRRYCTRYRAAEKTFISDQSTDQILTKKKNKKSMRTVDTRRTSCGGSYFLWIFIRENKRLSNDFILKIILDHDYTEILQTQIFVDLYRVKGTVHFNRRIGCQFNICYVQTGEFGLQ